CLSNAGFDIVTCGSGEEGLTLAEHQRFDVALCDVHLPGMDGLELLDRLQKLSPETFVLLITAYASVESAVQAFQRGAHDYLMKPILLNEVVAKVRRLLGQRKLALENQWLRRELNRDFAPTQIVGSSPAMRQVFQMLRRVAPTRSTVLILGESGTGKELIARAIHALSERRTEEEAKLFDAAGTGPPASRFLAVNC